MRRESGFDRVVGVSPEEESEILSDKKKIFETRYAIGKEGRSTEREKSIELKQCIEGMTRYMHGFLREYDAQALDIRPDQVHMVERDKLEKVSPSMIDEAAGSYDVENQFLFIYKEEDPENRLHLAHLIAHEMIHFNSFGSVQIDRDSNEQKMTQIRRGGLIIRSGSFLHFRELNEAVTEELAIRFNREYFNKLEYTRPEVEHHLNTLQTQLESSEKALTSIKNPGPSEKRYWESNIERIKKQLSEFNSAAYIEEAYIDERTKLYGMIDDIFNANKDQFTDKEEVFKIFAKAMLKGRLLPLARILDKTYGKGSFSKLAEDMEEMIKQ